VHEYVFTSNHIRTCSLLSSAPPLLFVGVEVPSQERNLELNWSRTELGPPEDPKNGSTILTSSTKIEPRVELELNQLKTGPKCVCYIVLYF
jgi:hypothetical protein